MMRSSSLLGTLLAACAYFLSAELRGQSFAPDTIVFKDGTLVHGLIVKNAVDTVTLQSSYQERTYPKKEIRRIRDEANTGVYFVDVRRQGSLPAWRAIANDLRTHDAVRKLQEIPATVRTEGPFCYVPYLAFRVNEDTELNIYGDPDDPAGIEMGIYGPRSRDEKLRNALRSFLAGFLFSKEEIALLYDIAEGRLSSSNGQTAVEIAARGGKGWWISISHPKRLQAARVSASEYKRITAPAAPGPGGQRSHRREDRGDDTRFFLRGFHRDADGVFHLP